MVNIVPFERPDKRFILAKETALMLLDAHGLASIRDIPHDHMLIVQRPQENDTEMHTLALSRVEHESESREQAWLLVYNS
jgi:hypothetical protein